MTSRLSGLSAIAPRLGHAHAQMRECERVLGWIRSNNWTGGIHVLVDARCYAHGTGAEWVVVERVSEGATPYPIKGIFRTANLEEIPGQWAFWEVMDIFFWEWYWPELARMHPSYPAPPEEVGIIDPWEHIIPCPHGERPTTEVPARIPETTTR